MLPFTREEFYRNFADYNAAIFPWQAVAGLLGAFAFIWVVRRRPSASLVAASTLALIWLWTGIAYHIVFFARIDWLAYLFGAAFVFQAGLFVYWGFVRRTLVFAPGSRLDLVLGLILILYAAILYPVVGMLTGHSYPAAPVFGVTPCPVTIFTFGLLVLTAGRVPRPLLAIPLLWSLVGGTAAILLGVAQDWALPLSGLVASARLLQRDGLSR